MRPIKPLAGLLLLLNLLCLSATAWSLHAEIVATPTRSFSLHELLPFSLALLALVTAISCLIGRKLRACRHEAEKFRLFLSQASDGIYILNEHGQVIEASDSFCRMLGRSRPDLLGRHVSGWIREWSASEVAEGVLQGYLSLDQPSTFEATQWRADDSYCEIEASAVGFTLHGRRHLFVCVREIEQRKRWEQMRDRLSAIVAASEDALVSCDREGRVSSWNPAAEQLFGCSVEEAVGQPVETLLGLPSPQALAQKVRQAIWGETVLRHQSAARSKLGEEISVTFTIAPLRSAGQQVVGVSLCIRNVTEQKAVETLLHLQSAALKASDDAILIAAVDGKVVWANPAYNRLSGYPKSATIGRRYHDFDYWQQAEPDFYEALMHGLLEGRLWRGETSSRRRDGSEYYEEQSITPFHDSGGQVSYFIAIKRDISERRRAKQALEAQQQRLEEEVRSRTRALEESREKIQLILDSSAAGLYGIDEQGRILFINRSGAIMLGQEPAALVGRSLHDCQLLPGDIPDHPLTPGTTGFAGETMLRHAAGYDFPARCESRPLILDGHEIGCVVSFTDITAQREADLAREAARTEAERLARAKGEFLANMSHEIRTPLNGILGTAQIGLRQSDRQPQMQRHFGRILDSGRLLLGIINDILDLSKLEAGKMQIEHVPVLLPPLAQSTAAMLAESARDKGLELTVDCAPELAVPCLGDPLRISQIMLNLIANAVKFTERGSIQLQLSYREQLEIRVRDSGIGIPPEQLQRMFAPFEQADGSTTRRYGGTGLGLSITRSLVGLMGGQISVSSEVGRGTEFIVRLPSPLADGLPTPPAAAFAGGDGSRRLAGMRVLVADDNEVNRLVVEEMLLAEGATVTSASDGLQALNRIRATPRDFDIVLMDVQMPELDGCAATRAIRQIADAPPVVAQTAHALAEERERCLAAGMLDQITKPLDQNQLVHVLLRHARQHASAAAQAALPDKPASASPVPPGIDWPVLEARYASKPDFIERLLKAGCTTLNSGIADLRQALAASDRQAVGRIAHGLKGCTATLAAQPLAELAGETEQCAYEACPALAGKAEELLAACIDLEKEIDQYLKPPCRQESPLGQEM
ncbi:PAS domain S-box protein [Dechloromonas sp. ZY10]|uniref:PAS domain S-box protein n=1 Tax=Dechloromonas aquae TaxID=2664436 RepID=UPI0035276676